MENNGIVSVTFDNKADRIYDYYVPTYICPKDIQNYAIVENMFYDGDHDLSPYSIVKILDYYPDDKDLDHQATKYIVAAINSENYISVRNIQNKKIMYYNYINDRLTNLLEEMNINDKIAILLAFDNDFDEYCIYE